VWVDRLNHRRLLIWTQTLAMIQAGILAGLVISGSITVWHIFALSVLLGLINAIDIPARQSFVVEMIDRREDLGNAIALNSSLVNVARLIGPSIAGLLIAAFGEGVCFTVNALSFMTAIGALVAMRVKSTNINNQHKRILVELADGFKYVFGFAPMRSVLLLLSLVSLLGMPYMVLMPVIAKDILHGDSRALGFLMGAAGAGALCGAIFLAGRQGVRGLDRLIFLAAVVFGVGLILFSQSRYFALSMCLIFFTGLGMMMQMASSNTILQSIADDDKRGRVMAFFTMAFLGMAPFGNLFAGVMAKWIGTTNTLLMGGIIVVAGAIWFGSRLGIYRAQIQPILVQKGL
jgi:MFS family permease